MNRRTFLSAMTRGFLAAPLAAAAQQVDKVARVGFLDDVSLRNVPWLAAFERRLSELGSPDPGLAARPAPAGGTVPGGTGPSRPSGGPSGPPPGRPGSVAETLPQACARFLAGLGAREGRETWLMRASAPPGGSCHEGTLSAARRLV